MDTPLGLAEATPGHMERQSTCIDPQETEKLKRLLNLIENDKINLGDVKVRFHSFLFLSYFFPVSHDLTSTEQNCQTLKKVPFMLFFYYYYCFYFFLNKCFVDLFYWNCTMFSFISSFAVCCTNQF
jgi:hypothetical protein